MDFVRHSMAAFAIMAFILRALKAASDPTRARILLLLAAEELTVAELQEVLGMGQSRISASLGLLKREELVSDRRVGKNIFYSSHRRIPAGLLPLLEAAAKETSDAANDQAALALTLKRRKDLAAVYFDRLAGKFGRTYIPGRSWQALTHALLSLQPPMVIADLGAGEGTLSQLLARNAKQIIAIDNSAKMVEFGASVAKANGFKNLEYRLGDIEEPPIEDASVDLAIFSQALHHAASPARAVASAHRILRPGGRILILDLAAHAYEQARELYAHVWLGFSEIELSNLLTEVGFSGVQTSIIAKEKQAPHFQTIMALGSKA